FNIKIVPTFPKRRFRHHVVALAYEGLSTFEFSIALEIFGIPQPDVADWYSFDICSTDKGPLSARGGVKIIPSEKGLGALRRADTILIPGWRGPDVDPPQELIAALQKAHQRGARLVSICSGVFVVAATGLLDGKSATTHWRYADKLAKRFPSITVK